MFDGLANDVFFRPITGEELLAVMKGFKKDESPGPYGWTIESFIHFYDFFKEDLLSMVEASRISGNINSAITATFITLIPKSDRADAFSDFRSIALCNILFKIIFEIIAERMKLKLSIHISNSQHAFLKD